MTSDSPSPSPSPTLPAGRFRLDRASTWMIGGAFLLATMAALSRGVGDRCDWLIVAFFRAMVMLVTSAILVRSTGASLVFWRPRTLWVRSLAGSFSLVCNFYAVNRLPLADAITLMNLQPLWIIVITTIFLRRRPSTTEILGVVCGLAGVALIERPHLSVDGLAASVALLSSASSAVAMLGLHRLRQVDPRAVVAHFAGVASFISASCLGYRWLAGSDLLFEPSGRVIGFLFAVGATGTLGQILLTKAYAAGSPAKIATVGLTQVVFAMIFDVLIWSRELNLATVAGFVLVLAPTTWLSLKAARAAEAKPVDSRAKEPAERN